MNIKFIDYESLRLVVNKIKDLINQKADIIHQHSSSEITTDLQNQFVNEEEKLRISKIKTDGDGSLVLTDNGTYQSITGSGDFDIGNITDEDVLTLKNKLGLSDIDSEATLQAITDMVNSIWEDV